MADTETTDVTLPNGVIITDVPVGTTRAQLQQRAIAGGYATLEDFGEVSAPEQNTPWFVNTANFFKRNMEIPVGLGGSVIGGIAGSPFGPPGVVIGSVIGGSIGSGGGSLLSDVFEGEELDYAEAVQEAAISAGFDVVTLGVMSKAKPFIRAMRAGNVSPEAAARRLMENARLGQAAGSQESLLASQNILMRQGATLTPFQTGNASGLQVFGQRLAETGILSRQVTAESAERVNQVVSQSLEDIITRGGVELGSDASSLGRNMYDVIQAGKTALSQVYSTGLEQIQRQLGTSMVSTRSASNAVQEFLRANQYTVRSGSEVVTNSLLDDATIQYANRLINALGGGVEGGTPLIRAVDLLEVEKKLARDLTQYGDFNSGVYNSVVERQLTQLSNTFRGSVENTLSSLNPVSSEQYRALQKAYSEGIQGLLPSINETFIRRATEENYSSLGRMLTQTGSIDQIRKFMSSIDTAYAQLARAGDDTLVTTFRTADEAKQAISQAYLRNMFPNLGPEFDINAYRNLAGQLNNPTQQARMRAILGEDYPMVKQLVNIMSEASQRPTSNIGELVLRSKEYAAGGGVAAALATGIGGPAAVGVAGTVLFSPVVLAKMTTNPSYVAKLLAFDKVRFTSTDAMGTSAMNLVMDFMRTLPEDERIEVQNEIDAMTQVLGQ